MRRLNANTIIHTFNRRLRRSSNLAYPPWTEPNCNGYRIKPIDVWKFINLQKIVFGHDRLYFTIRQGAVLGDDTMIQYIKLQTIDIHNNQEDTVLFKKVSHTIQDILTSVFARHNHQCICLL